MLDDIGCVGGRWKKNPNDSFSSACLFNGIEWKMVKIKQKNEKNSWHLEVDNCIITKSVVKRTNVWDHSSAGRASALQAEGHRFEPYWSHFARKFFKVENIEREMWRALRAMHTALKSWYKNISYGGIAQLARARGSYPRCRWFKSSSRYYKKESLCGASFCVISILSFMKTLNIICHIPTFILKL